MLPCVVFSRIAGSAIAISKAAAKPPQRSGRRRTRPTTALQKRLSPTRWSGLRRPGTFPLFTRSPSFESTAGRTVSEPSTDTATTRIVPAAKLLKVASPLMNMADIATITVTPEIRTERPDVAAAASIEAHSVRPAARSSRARLR